MDPVLSEVEGATCARCGALKLDGPAADLGFPICAECWAWRSPREADHKRTNLVRWERIANRALFVAIAGWIYIKYVGGPIIDLAVLIMILVAAVTSLGLHVYSSIARRLYLRRWPRRTTETLGFPLGRLAAACPPGTFTAIILRMEDDAADPGRKDLTGELSYLAASARGLLMYGSTLSRVAVPWSAIEIAPHGGARGLTRISPRSNTGKHHFVYTYERRLTPRILRDDPLRAELARLQAAG